MHVLRVPRLAGADHRGGKARWRRAALMTMAVLPVTAIAALAAPASAAGGYTVSATIGVGVYPIGVAVDPVTHTAYVTNLAGNSVSAIDEATDTVTAAFGDQDSDGVAVDPVTHTVYLANNAGNSVSAIDEATNTVTATIPVSGYPNAVAVDPTTGKVYVTTGENTVSVIDEATNTVTATITVGSYPQGIAVDPTTHTAYVVNTFAGATYGTVSVISADGFQAPAIWSENHGTFRHGKHGSFTVRASGLPVPSMTEAGKLPPGVRLTAGAKGTAVIAGTPAASTKGKTYIITLTARNGDGKAATQRFTLRVSLKGGEDPTSATRLGRGIEHDARLLAAAAAVIVAFMADEIIAGWRRPRSRCCPTRRT